MSDHNHEQWLGMAALSAGGMLPREEADDFAAHVASCERCHNEVAELRAVARALNEAPMVDDPSAPPEVLKERVVWAVRGARRSQQRHRRIVSAVAAAAAAIALIGVGMAVPPPAGPPQEVLDVATTSESVDAKAALVAHTWGTELKLVVSGLDHGERYRVTFVDDDGRKVSAGTFIGVSDRPVVCDMNAAVLRPDAARVEVAAADGGVVLAADLQRRGP